MLLSACYSACADDKVLPVKRGTEGNYIFKQNRYIFIFLFTTFTCSKTAMLSLGNNLLSYLTMF